MHRHPSPTYAPHICNAPRLRVVESGRAAAYVDRDADVSETLIQTLAAGLLVALLAMELVLAVTSWLEAGGRARSNHRTPLLLRRSFAIRDHFRAERARLSSRREEQRELRLPGHRRRVRDAVRRLQPTRLTEALAGCLDCRGSRLRGLARCQGCARPLVEPVHAAVA